MITTTDDKKKWLTSDHSFFKYNGGLAYIVSNGKKSNAIKYKHLLQTEFLFLDVLKIGCTRNDVLENLGDPLFIYKDYCNNLERSVFSYGLKSGSHKIKIEIHLFNGLFYRGYLSYFFKNDFNAINAYLSKKFQLNDFNFLRDIVVDSCRNVIDFNVVSDQFLMTFTNNDLLFESNKVML